MYRSLSDELDWIHKIHRYNALSDLILTVGLSTDLILYGAQYRPNLDIGAQYYPNSVWGSVLLPDLENRAQY